MEIRFALWQYQKDEFGELQASNPIIVDSWTTVGEKAREGYKLQGLTYHVFQMFKALEYNEHFLKEREKFRKEFNIPEEIDFKKYLENMRYFKPKKKLSKANFTQSPLFKEMAFVGNLEQKYRMPYHVRELLIDLFYTGVVRFIPPYGGEVEIAVSPEQQWLNPKAVELKITSPHVTKNALKKFIEKHWDRLEPYIRALPAENKALISDNDLELMSWRKKYKTIPKMTMAIYLAKNPGDVLTKKEKDVKEATVKSAFFRAKEKIDELFRPIGKKKKKVH